MNIPKRDELFFIKILQKFISYQYKNIYRLYKVIPLASATWLQLAKYREKGLRSGWKARKEAQGPAIHGKASHQGKGNFGRAPPGANLFLLENNYVCNSVSISFYPSVESSCVLLDPLPLFLRSTLIKATFLFPWLKSATLCIICEYLLNEDRELMSYVYDNN